MKQLPLVISTPEREVYRDQVESVSLPTVDGEITVLAGHAPIVTVLKAGELTIRKDGEAHPYVIGGGFVEIDGKQLTVLADTAEHVEEIDEGRAEEAKRRAQELKHTKHEDTEEYAGMLAKLERDLARLRVVRKHRDRITPGGSHRGHHGIEHEAIRKD